MKKIPVFLLLAGLLFSCSSAEEEEKNRSGASAQQMADEFLSVFQEVKFDSLFVFAAEENHESAAYPFRGKLIDARFYSFFEHQPATAYENLEDQRYACCKFKIDSALTGLICRTPGEYQINNLRLYVWDHQKQQIISGIELADSWGDAGDSFELMSMISRPKKLKAFLVKSLSLFSSVYLSEVEQDKEFEMKAEHYDSVFRYTLAGTSFTLTSRHAADSSTIRNFLSQKVTE